MPKKLTLTAVLALISMFAFASQATASDSSATDQYRMGLGEKGMLYAAKILAATTLDYMAKPELVQQVRREWEAKTKGFVYDPIVPRGQKPPRVSGVATRD